MTASDRPAETAAPKDPRRSASLSARTLGIELTWRELVPILSFFLLLTIAATFTDAFFTERNISNLLRQIVANGLISLGMLIVILTGGIDLSVGSVVALGGVLFAGLADRLGIPRGDRGRGTPRERWPAWPTALSSRASGCNPSSSRWRRWASSAASFSSTRRAPMSPRARELSAISAHAGRPGVDRRC